MKIDELKKLNQNAPCTGQLLAYTRNKIVFEKYASIDDVVTMLDNEDLLEIHLFDSKKEYRAINSLKRGKQEIIEYVADFKYSRETTYMEEACLEKAMGYAGSTIKILNHVSYDEMGMASIDDYRLMMGGVK